MSIYYSSPAFAYPTTYGPSTWGWGWPSYGYGYAAPAYRYAAPVTTYAAPVSRVYGGVARSVVSPVRSYAAWGPQWGCPWGRSYVAPGVRLVRSTVGAPAEEQPVEEVVGEVQAEEVPVEEVVEAGQETAEVQAQE